MPVIRRAGPEDFDAVAAIQSASPHAAQWPVADYTLYEFMVAVEVDVVVGFVVWRTVANGECELLNLAVAAEFRRRGIARHLMEALLILPENQTFLEVRESNQVARLFYKSIGFQEVSIRREYYSSPLEAAIVMKFHSC
jgi:[ribosomal protein S18]-alanine N-acetyltransferase